MDKLIVGCNQFMFNADFAKVKRLMNTSKELDMTYELLMKYMNVQGRNMDTVEEVEMCIAYMDNLIYQCNEYKGDYKDDIDMVKKNTADKREKLSTTMKNWKYN